MKVTNEEVIRKILGFMQMLSKQQVPDIKIVFEDDKIVTTDSKILIEIARGLQNDK